MKFKIQIARRDAPTIHGVLHAESKAEALAQLNLPAGYIVGRAEEVPTNHACFYDAEFNALLKHAAPATV